MYVDMCVLRAPCMYIFICIYFRPLDLLNGENIDLGQGRSFLLGKARDSLCRCVLGDWGIQSFRSLHGQNCWAIIAYLSH